MFPNPSESSVADDIAHNLASQEIIGVGEKQTIFFLVQLHFQNVACITTKRSVFSSGWGGQGAHAHPRPCKNKS